MCHFYTLHCQVAAKIRRQEAEKEQRISLQGYQTFAPKLIIVVWMI